MTSTHTSQLTTVRFVAVGSLYGITTPNKIKLAIWNSSAESVTCIDDLSFVYGIFIGVYCVSNMPTLASCSFDKHGLILIIFSKQHQHTSESDMHV